MSSNDENITIEINLNSSNENEFDDSLKNLKSNDINSSYTGKQKPGPGRKDLVRVLSMVLCISVFAFCVYSIADDYINKLASKNFYDQISEQISQKSEVSRIPKASNVTPMNTLLDSYWQNNNTEPEISGNIDITEYDALLVYIEKLKDINNDLYGYIRSSGGIDFSYPIMRGHDNSYYLYRDINKKYKNPGPGSIFVDSDNSSTHGKDRNTVVYGHNMSSDGSMFNTIARWYKAGCKNPGNIKIEVITSEKVYIYELFSVYTQGGRDFIEKNFRDNNDYYSFLKRIKGFSTSKMPSNSYNTSSSILTLVTCTNVKANPDERYVVHAILKEIINL